MIFNIKRSKTMVTWQAIATHGGWLSQHMSVKDLGALGLSYNSITS
jgi:hypothetical protein